MTYSELQQSVADFLNRQDLAGAIPTFITLVEAYFNRQVRHRSMLTRATTTLDSQFTGLPTDFLEAKNVQLNSTPVVSLEYVTLERADELRASTPTGQPAFYTILGDQIEVVPVPDTQYTIELVYYKKIPTLTDDTTSNWLLSSHPDAYLYGALMQAAPYLKNDERLQVWGPLFVQSVGGINESSDKAEYSGSRLKMRTNW